MSAKPETASFAVVFEIRNLMRISFPIVAFDQEKELI